MNKNGSMPYLVWFMKLVVLAVDIPVKIVGKTFELVAKSAASPQQLEYLKSFDKKPAAKKGVEKALKSANTAVNDSSKAAEAAAAKAAERKALIEASNSGFEQTKG
jgi:hypothetical protein